MEILTAKEYMERKPRLCILRTDDPILGANFCIIKDGRICQTATELVHGTEENAIAHLRSIPEDEIG